MDVESYPDAFSHTTVVVVGTLNIAHQLPVPGSIKLYKVDNHYENVMGSMKSS